MSPDHQPIRRRPTSFYDAAAQCEAGRVNDPRYGTRHATNSTSFVCTANSESEADVSPTAQPEESITIVAVSRESDQLHVYPPAMNAASGGVQDDTDRHMTTAASGYLSESDEGRLRAVKEQVHQLLFVSPQMGRPNPSYRLTTELHESYTHILDLLKETRGVDAFKTVDKDILSVTRSMKELWPLAIQGLICQREVKKVLDFYRGHAENSSIGSDHAIHQRLLKISNELLPAVAEAARELLQKLNANRKAIEGHQPAESRSTKVLSFVDTWGGVLIRACVGLTNIVNTVLSGASGDLKTAAFHTASMCAQAWGARKDVLTALKPSAPTEAVVMEQKLKSAVDDLIFNCQVFLAATEELDNQLRSLDKPGAWDANADGVLGAYLTGFDLDNGSFDELENLLLVSGRRP